MNRATLRVQVVGHTQFTPPDDVDWSTDADGGQALAEFAGRACYQSWTKPNPRTATNAGYLAHIVDVGHFSVLEHGVVSMYITGVSRSLTHELVRHRHFSYSQLSQRYVDERYAAVVEPDVIAADPYLSSVFQEATTKARQAYAELVHGLERALTAGRPLNARMPTTALRKAARQAARSVLPNATETRIVVTGNYRAWRHFITMRASEHADVEIRALAIDCLARLAEVAPNVFADFVVRSLDDGTLAAATGGGGHDPACQVYTLAEYNRAVELVREHLEWLDPDERDMVVANLLARGQVNYSGTTITLSAT